jgi:hypothetical protein
MRRRRSGSNSERRCATAARSLASHKHNSSSGLGSSSPPSPGSRQVALCRPSRLAQIDPYEGAKADPAWSHRLSGPHGEPVGTLTLMRTAGGWSMQDFVHWTATWDMAGLGAKAPSAGASLQLQAPAGEELADLLVAALLDISTLPRGYIA